MKPYGKNDKEKYYLVSCGHCNCYRCIPVKKGTKKSERQKVRTQLKSASKR